MTDKERIFVEYRLHILPQHMQEAIYRYISQGIEPGSFAFGVLCNDLVEAFACADDINSAHMRVWANWLYNYAPRECWGSPAKVAAWAAHRGLSGLKDEE